MTDLQMRWIFFRKRDKNGMLVRGKQKSSGGQDDVPLKIKKRKSYKAMFFEVMLHRGLSKDQTEVKWQAWLLDNPSYVKLMGGKRKKR